jgi:hypothetical protein
MSLEDPMFLLVDRHGIYTVVDGVPISFEGPNALSDYNHARERSPGVPVVWMHHNEGKRMLTELLKKHAAALR